MNNETIELILRMQDQATAVYKKFESGIMGSMQKVGSFISKNWASIGVGIGAAFYVAIQALERVDKIAKKVSQSAGDINARKAAAELQKVAEYAQKAQDLVDEMIVRASLLAVGIGNAIAVFFASLYTSVAFVIEKITGSLATMAEYSAAAFSAISPSLSANLLVAATKLRGFETTAKSFVDAGVGQIKRYAAETVSALSATFASKKNLGLEKEPDLFGLTAGMALTVGLAIDKAKIMLGQFADETDVMFGGISKHLTTPQQADEQQARRNLEDQVTLEAQIREASYSSELDKEQKLLEEWYTKAQEMAHGNVFQLEEIDRVYRDRKRELDIASIQKTMESVQSITSQVTGILVGFSKNRTDAEIQDIEKRKNAQLEAIDEQLAKETLSEKERNLLLDKRKKLENEFNNQIRDAKKKQFQAEKQAAIISAIMETALAVIKSLPNIPLAIAVGILGAAKIGVIASQPTPEFHQGGTVQGPEGKEVIAVLQAGETVRTREQEKALSAGATVIININAPGTPVEMVKKAVEEGMRRTNLAVTDYFVRNKETLVLS